MAEDPRQDLETTAKAGEQIERSMRNLLDVTNRHTGIISKIQSTGESIYDFMAKEHQGSKAKEGKAVQAAAERRGAQPDPNTELRRTFPWLFKTQATHQQAPAILGGGGPGGEARVRDWLKEPPGNQGGTPQQMEIGRGGGSGKFWGFLQGMGLKTKRGAAFAQAEEEAGIGGLAGAAGKGAAVAGGLGGIAGGMADTNALTGAGKIAGGAGMAGAAIPYAGPFILAIGKMTQVALEAVDKIRKFGDKLHEQNAQFAQYSPRMAAVMARQRVRDIQYSYSRGEALAGSAEELEQARSRMRDRLAPMENAWGKMQNYGAGMAMNGASAPFEAGNGIVGATSNPNTVPRKPGETNWGETGSKASDYGAFSFGFGSLFKTIRQMNQGGASSNPAVSYGRPQHLR